MREEREENLPPGAIPTSLPDFVLARLCGTEPSVEVTLAQSYGAVDLRLLDWHREVIARLGLGGLRWPEIRAQGECVGALNVGGHELPCYTPVGDHQCALLGALLREDELSLNISTGSQVSRISAVLDLGGDYQTRPYFDGWYLKTAIHVPAGRALNALIRLLSELAEAQGVRIPDPWAYIERVSMEADATELRVNLAFFPSSCGERGAIANMREDQLTVGHVFRAAFENMADNYYAFARRLSPVWDWKRIVFSGGLAQKNDLLRRLILERFQTASRFSPSSEDALLGLLVLALAFTGRKPSIAEASQSVATIRVRS